MNNFSRYDDLHGDEREFNFDECLNDEKYGGWIEEKIFKLLEKEHNNKGTNNEHR